jgi:hypothetical protein
MSRHCECTIRIIETGEAAKLVFELSDQDVFNLSRFLENVDRLSRLPIVQSGLPSSLKIVWDKERFHVSTSIPSPTDLFAALHALRPFVLSNEPFSFDRTCGILGRLLPDPLARRLLRHARKIYSGELMQEQIQISAQDVVVNSEATLMTWFNSHEYHQDQEKTAAIQAISHLLPLEANKAIFVMLLSNKVDAIASLAALLRVVLGLDTTSEIQIARDSSKKP